MKTIAVYVVMAMLFMSWGWIPPVMLLTIVWFLRSREKSEMCGEHVYLALWCPEQIRDVIVELRQPFCFTMCVALPSLLDLFGPVDYFVKRTVTRVLDDRGQQIPSFLPSEIAVPWFQVDTFVSQSVRKIALKRAIEYPVVPQRSSGLLIQWN
jgi:hypothetical protein